MTEIRGTRKKELLERDIKTFEDLIKDLESYLKRIDNNLYLIENNTQEVERNKVQKWIEEKQIILNILKRQLENEFPKF